MKKMNSVNQTFKFCNEYNIGISRRLLLTLVNSGEIPSVRAGRSVLINWEALMDGLRRIKGVNDGHRMEI